MIWKPTTQEKAWIRTSAADAANLNAGQVTIDVQVGEDTMEWKDFVRAGIDPKDQKYAYFYAYEMVGFGKTRKRGNLKTRGTLYIDDAPRPKLVQIISRSVIRYGTHGDSKTGRDP